MKFKRLGLAMLPLATAGVVLPMVVSCGDGEKTVSFDDAKAWVKTNFGEAEKDFVKPTKATSTWNMTGKVTKNNAEPTETQMGYHKNHLINMFRYFSFGADDKVSKTYENGYTAGTTLADRNAYVAKTDKLTENDKKIEVLDDDIQETAAKKVFFNPLVEKNIDDVVLGFFGYSGRVNTKFIVNSKDKTLKMSGTFTVYLGESAGMNVLQMPYATLTFNSSGLLTDIRLDFGKYSQGFYYWWNSSTTKLDYFEFTMTEGDFIHFAYAY